MSDDLPDHLGVQAARLQGMVHRIHGLAVARDRLNVEWRRVLDVSSSEMTLLCALWAHGTMTISQAREHTGISGPAMTSLTDNLVARGLIERVHDEHDRRRVLLSASTVAHDHYTALASPIAGRLSEASTSYSDEHLAQIEEYLALAQAAYNAAASLR